MKWAVAIGLILYGVFYLLTALGLSHHSESYFWNLYWPGLLILYGLESLYRRIRKGSAHLLTPIVILLVGVLFLLKNLHVVRVDFIHPLDLVYAIVLIYAGIMLLGRGRIRVHFGASSSQRSSHFDVRDAAYHAGEPDDRDVDDWEEGVDRTQRPSPVPSIRRMPKIGEMRYGDGPWHLEPLLLESLVGSIRINLITASISTGETPIIINGGAGEIRIQVPVGLPVSVRVELFSGEVRLFETRDSGVSLHPVLYEDPEYEQAETRVRIQVKLRFGEVRITRMI
ncbi:MAG: cell wall-active antibiotics response protein LiaF [Firmicutes bacterium]|nr:cell wall-active antibiotics response protein LiaF [Bacillota bacterium]